MRESKIESYLVEKVESLGGEVRKVKWIGRRAAPDRLVMMPDGRTIFVELKAPRQIAKPHQVREHERMRRMGQTVVIIDSMEGVDRLFS